MTERLTKVINGVLDHDASKSLRLRYVTDAGNSPRGYFENFLRTMKHPHTGKPPELHITNPTAPEGFDCGVFMRQIMQ